MGFGSQPTNGFKASCHVHSLSWLCGVTLGLRPCSTAPLALGESSFGGVVQAVWPGPAGRWHSTCISHSGDAGGAARGGGCCSHAPRPRAQLDAELTSVVWQEGPPRGHCPAGYGVCWEVGSRMGLCPLHWNRGIILQLSRSCGCRGGEGARGWEGRSCGGVSLGAEVGCIVFLGGRMGCRMGCHALWHWTRRWGGRRTVQWWHQDPFGPWGCMMPPSTGRCSGAAEL